VCHEIFFQRINQCETPERSQYNGKDRSEIVGTEGLIRAHTRTGKLELLGVEGKDIISPLENNRANLAVCLAFYEAAREHKVVAL